MRMVVQKILILRHIYQSQVDFHETSSMMKTPHILRHHLLAILLLWPALVPMTVSSHPGWYRQTSPVQDDLAHQANLFKPAS